MSDHTFARRTLLKSAGLGIGAFAFASSTQARAQGAQEIWSAEYWANKGPVKLNLWRKRLGAPQGSGAPRAGEAAKPVLFLVHGSSNSARSSYDLAVPGNNGNSDYSMMNVFARYGFDVWTMDHDGYGRSGSSGNSSDIASGVEDLKAAMPIVLKETGRAKAHVYGTSSGAIRAGAFAQAEPTSIDRLVLTAFTYKGSGAEEIARRVKRIEEFRANPRRKRDANMIRSIFTRDGHASTYDPAVAEAIIVEELKFGDTIPSGTYLDMAANLPLVDPTKVTCPVLMIRGEFDGNSTNDDLLDFYRQLPNGDRQFAILPNTAHSAGYSNNRHLLYYAIRQFLEAPAPLAG